MLSHYDGVIWYTGDDNVTRNAGRGPGNGDRLALDEMLEMRAYMNEGGRVAYTGKRAGQQFTGVGGVGSQLYDPKDERLHPLPTGVDPRRCLLLRGSVWAATSSTTCSSTGSEASSRWPDDGFDEKGDPFDVNGIEDPFGGCAGASTAPTARTTRTPTRRSSRRAASCRRTEYPQFESWASSRWASRAGRSTRTRAPVRLLAARGRVVQAAGARRRGAGLRRLVEVLDLL